MGAEISILNIRITRRSWRSQAAEKSRIANEVTDREKYRAS